MNQYLKRNFHILFIAFTTVVIYFRSFLIWSSDKSYIFGDTNTYALNLSYLAQNFWSILDPKNSIYLWNPYHLLGIPMLSSIDSGLFYPPNIVIALLARLIGNPLLALPLYSLSIFIHLIIASVFVYKILRHWSISVFPALIGAVLWLGLGFNSEFISSALVMMAGSYLPIGIYYLLKWEEDHKFSYYILFYICITLSFLLGYPMISLLVYLTSLIFQLIYGSYLNRKSFLSFLRMHTIGFLLITFPFIAPQYITSLSLFKYSVRSTLSLESFLGNAVLPSNLVESFLPLQRYMSHQVSSTPVFLYFSIVGIIILLQSKDTIWKDKKNIWLLIFFFITLLLSFGKVTSIADLIYYFVPGVNLFRRLAVFSLVPGFIFCIFVARSFESSIKHKNISEGTAFVLKTIVILLFVVQLVGVLQLEMFMKSFDINIYYYSLAATLVLIVMIILALFIYESATPVAQILIMAVLLIELSTHTASLMSLNSKINPSLFFKPNIIMQKIQEIAKPGERVNITSTHNNYSSHYMGIEQLSGYVSLGSQYASEVIKLLYTPEYNPQNLQDILGVKYTVDKVESKQPKDILIRIPSLPYNKSEVYFNNPTSKQWEPESANTAFFIHNNETALSRLYLAKEIHVGIQSKDILQEIPHFDRQTVYLDSVDIKEGNFQYTGDIHIEEYKRNYIKASVKIADEGFLANSTPYYSGWTVKVNGQPAKLIQTNWLMMGVYLPRGENIVEFQYSSRPLLFGFIYLIAAGIIWLLFRKKIRNLLSS